jgi:hypothetical protein
MAQAIRDTSQEYWRPGDPAVAHVVQAPRVMCPNCDAELVIGARFCHTCGGGRAPTPVVARWPTKLADFMAIETIRRKLDLSLGSLVFLILGLACMTGAVVTSLIYKTKTLLDWQAVQVWRIEWLLGAAAALLAGILLKKNTTSI